MRRGEKASSFPCCFSWALPKPHPFAPPSAWPHPSRALYMLPETPLWHLQKPQCVCVCQCKEHTGISVLSAYASLFRVLSNCRPTCFVTIGLWGKETNQCGFGSMQRTLGMWPDPRKNYLCISVHQSRSHLHHMLKPKDQHLPRAYSSWLCLTRTPLLTYKSGQGASTFTRQLHGARHPLTPVSAFKIMPTSPTYSFNWFDLIYFAPNCQPGKSY